MAITPIVGPHTFISVGGTSVIAAPTNPTGGLITNPLFAVDQGVDPAEPLYLDPTGATPGLTANGTVFSLQPGQTWNLIPGQTTPTLVNAATSGHKFSVVIW